MHCCFRSSQYVSVIWEQFHELLDILEVSWDLSIGAFPNFNLWFGSEFASKVWLMSFVFHCDVSLVFLWLSVDIIWYYMWHGHPIKRGWHAPYKELVMGWLYRISCFDTKNVLRPGWSRLNPKCFHLWDQGPEILHLEPELGNPHVRRRVSS